jgi:hypothetical protein
VDRSRGTAAARRDSGSGKDPGAMIALKETLMETTVSGR